MAATTIPTTGKQTAVTLRALEHDVETLADLPLNELPPAARAILRNVGSLLMVSRWLVEDAIYGKVEG